MRVLICKMDEAKATVQNAFIIVFVATAIGIIYNFPFIKYFLSHGLDFSSDENVSRISLFEAKYLFDTGEGFFIDARSRTEYKKVT